MYIDVAEFDPLRVFGNLFDSACKGALGSCYDSLLFIKVVRDTIREQICHLFRRVEEGSTAAAVHRRTITSQSEVWKTVLSNQCCLVCLSAKPEHVLACGQFLCDDCVRIFGKSNLKHDHCFDIKYCIHCSNKSQLTVFLKPRTAGIRILSVDGGGVRGIVPLEFLPLLQRKLGHECRVQDVFDLALGTSAGEPDEAAVT